MDRLHAARWFSIGLMGLAIVLSASGSGWAQIPGLPAIPKDEAAAKEGEPNVDAPTAAPTEDNPDATVAATEGPIKVEATVDDYRVQETLNRLLLQYPGVRNVEATVNEGVAVLEGQVENEAVHDNVTQFVRRVEGVSLVLNRMKTDAQLLSGRQQATRALAEIWHVVERKWLLFLIAVGIALGAIGLSRLFQRYSDLLLSPFVENLLLRSVVSSILGPLIVFAGLMLALSLLNLSEMVLSILGFAGVAGLAIGFAFRDIAENFIASLLLGVRRPFQVGDYIEVSGKAGVIKSLNTRATVLVTLEGKHIRIPNSVIFKEILTNSTASPSTRQSFDVMIPYEASTAKAMEAINRSLNDLDGVLSDPPARALLEALEPGGVRLRAYFWVPVQGVDGLKLQSDARLKCKVALQEIGIVPPPSRVLVSGSGRFPLDVARSDGQAPGINGAGITVSAAQARHNLRQDARAAENVEATAPTGESTPMEHVLNQAEHRVSEEGDNLLAEKKS